MFSTWDGIVKAIKQSFARPGHKPIWIVKDTNDERYTWSYHPENYESMGYWQKVAKFENGQLEELKAGN